MCHHINQIQSLYSASSPFNQVIVHSPNSNHIILGRDSWKPLHYLKMCKISRSQEIWPPISHKLLISFPCTSRVKLIGRVPHLRVTDSGERITAPATNPLASFRKMREKMSLDGQKDPQKYRNDTFDVLAKTRLHPKTLNTEYRIEPPINKYKGPGSK